MPHHGPDVHGLTYGTQGVSFVQQAYRGWLHNSRKKSVCSVLSSARLMGILLNSVLSENRTRSVSHEYRTRDTQCHSKGRSVHAGCRYPSTSSGVQTRTHRHRCRIPVTSLRKHSPPAVSEQREAAAQAVLLQRACALLGA
jgi:hypothetical protein